MDLCYDGEDALEMIYAEKYDLIVLDLNLPGVDGMEILRELRKENEETKSIDTFCKKSDCGQGGRSSTQGQTIIWKSHFIYKN